jgi:hypothetical protein
MEATRQGWSGRKEVLGTSGNSEDPSSGCETCPAKAQSGRPVASLATERVTATAMRRHAKTWAVGMQLRNPHSSRRPRPHRAGRQQRRLRYEADEETVQPAECSTTARVQEDGPVIWEALPLLHERGPVPRDPVTNPCGSASVGARAARPRTSPGRGGRPERGEPERGREGVQGVGGPNKSADAGERRAPGPGRAKAARAGVSFWRET